MSAEVKELLPICENLDSAQNLQDKGEPTPAAAAAAVAAAAAAVAAAAKPQQRSKGHRGNHQQAKNQSSLLAATGAKSQIQSKATTLAFNPCKRRIAKDEISKLPLIAWEGPVKVLSTVPEMEAAVSKLLQQNVTHLGFDTESLLSPRANSARSARLCLLVSYQYDQSQTGTALAHFGIRRNHQDGCGHSRGREGIS
jgi:hypothetical protein